MHSAKNMTLSSQRMFSPKTYKKMNFQCISSVKVGGMKQKFGPKAFF
jgi:hypothetical protein